MCKVIKESFALSDNKGNPPRYLYCYQIKIIPGFFGMIVNYNGIRWGAEAFASRDVNGLTVQRHSLFSV